MASPGPEPLLHHRGPYDFGAMLEFLRGRALPGVEVVDERSYARAIGAAKHAGWVRVSSSPSVEHALQLELLGGAPEERGEIVSRLRRMFDLDADPAAIGETLSGDPRLRPLVRARPGLRLPSGWDGFEIAVRAIVGQQVSVAAGRTFSARLARGFGTVLPDAGMPGLERSFPTAEVLADADLSAIGLTRARADTLRAMSRAVLDGRVDFDRERTLDDFVARWVALPGIGPWTAHYIAMRALGHPDAFPADDLVLQKAVPADGTRWTAKALGARAERWRPWRAYAVIHLWKAASIDASAAARGNDR